MTPSDEVRPSDGIGDCCGDTPSNSWGRSGLPIRALPTTCTDAGTDAALPRDIRRAAADEDDVTALPKTPSAGAGSIRKPAPARRDARAIGTRRPNAMCVSCKVGTAWQTRSARQCERRKTRHTANTHPTERHGDTQPLSTQKPLRALRRRLAVLHPQNDRSQNRRRMTGRHSDLIWSCG